MLQVAINGKPAFERFRTGIEEYTYQLLKQWAVLPLGAVRLKVYTQRLADNAAQLGQTMEEFLGGPVPDHLTFEVLRAQRLWTQLRLSWALLKDRPDVFFNPMQILPRYAPRRSVITVHDLGYEYFPEAHSFAQFRYLRLTTQDAANRSSAIIAVSENTRQDLINYYKIPKAKIVVIHHGFSLPDRFGAKVLKEIHHKTDVGLAQERRPYFLFLGRLEARKNIEFIIRAFEVVRFRQNLNYQLVLAGKPGFGYANIKKAIETSPARNDILEVGHVFGPAKFKYLQQAGALVFPSLYEGFGLPVLEAQALGVPVVTSTVSSLPEVGGHGAVYIDPYNEESLADALYKVVSYPQFRAHYIHQGYRNTRRFSWRATAEETWRVIKAVAQSRAYFV